MRPKKFPDIPVSLEENTEVPGTTSSVFLVCFSLHGRNVPQPADLTPKLLALGLARRQVTPVDVGGVGCKLSGE